MLVVCIFLLAVLGGLAATVLSVNEARNYKRLVRQFGLENYLLPPPPAPTVRIGRQRRLVASSRQLPRLVRPDARDESPLVRPNALTAKERCDTLAGIGGEAPNFVAGAAEWECTVFKQFGEDTDAASLFIQAKGLEDHQLRTFRIKFSFTDARQNDKVLQGGLAALDSDVLSLSPDSQSYLKDRLTDRVTFKSMLENYRAALAPEMMDQRRYNLLLIANATTRECLTPSDQPQGAPQRTVIRAPIDCLALPSGRAFLPQT